MQFRDQHNHNSQPQLLDVLAFSLDFLTLQVSCLLVFLYFCFFFFLGVEVFASKHGKKDAPRKDKQV